MDEDDLHIDRGALLAVFVATADDTFAEVEESLVLLEASPRDEELLRTALRGLHTLKGNAATIALDEIAQLAHTLEEPLAAVRAGTVRITPRLVAFLLGGLDMLRELVRDSGAESDAASPGTFRRTPSSDGARAIRVSPERADRMLTLVSELAIARAQIEQHLERGAMHEALQRYRDSERMHVELEDLVMYLRAVPVEPVLRQYARALHDAAARCGKRARLVVDAAGVELDGTIIDRLRDPLLHAVRNAVDHGIEPESERIARGKDPTGVVTLRARHDAGSVVVIVEDDGRGFDRARILERARSRGAVPPDSLSDEEVFRFVFEAGFSTADVVTDLSGRGVGMDVVSRNVSALRGRIDVANPAEGGARITIRLPLTLAIIEGFAVDAGGEQFIIPSATVDEFIGARALEKARTAKGLLRWRGAAVSFVPLAKLFALDAASSAEEVVLVRHGSGRVALAVDAIHGSKRVVIKPLLGLAKTTDGIAGGAIVGSGRVAFVLDVPSILRRTGAYAAAELG
jgi:two-component system chemotaxis sensor kinase CheA